MKKEVTVKVLTSGYAGYSSYGNPKKMLCIEYQSGAREFAHTASNAMCGYISYRDNGMYRLTYHYTRTGRMIVDNAEEVTTA